MPYHVFGESSGALSLTIAWMRSAMTRSGSGISAILATTSRSASSLLLAAFSSLARSFIAAFSSAVNPFEAFFCVSFMAGSSCAICAAAAWRGR
jgi:hypothetical protein